MVVVPACGSYRGNNYGELGTGDFTNRISTATLTDISINTPVLQVSVSKGGNCCSNNGGGCCCNGFQRGGLQTTNFACALLNNGGVRCWGGKWTCLQVRKSER